MDTLDAMVQPASLADLPRLGAEILKIRVRDRVVVDVNAWQTARLRCHELVTSRALELSRSNLALMF